MKNIFYRLFSVSLLAVWLMGCEDETKYLPLPEAVPFTMSVSNTAFVMGEKLVVDLDINPDAEGNEVLAKEDFDIYFTAKLGTEDVSGVFKDFHNIVTFPKGEKNIRVEFPLKETGLEGSKTFNFVAFSRGYEIGNPSFSMKVSDYYRVNMAIQGNADNIVTEGDQFVLVASLDKPRAIPVVVTIDAEDASSFDTEFPYELTIPAGALSAKSDPISIAMDGVKTGDKELTLNFASNSTANPMKSDKLVITMTDLESLANPDMYDPTLVYEHPEYPFVSSKCKSNFDKWWNSRSESVAMTGKTSAKPEDTDYKSLTPHPNSTLAAEGWKFWSGVEFHFIQQSFGWGMPSSPNTSFGNYKHWSFNYIPTKSIQDVFAANRDKCSNVTDNGTYQLWVQAGSTPGDGLGASRDYGSAAVYIGRGGSGASTRFIHINPGMRIEMRVRVKGDRTGIVPVIELRDAPGGVFDKQTQRIDILRNTKGNLVTQGVFSTMEDGAKTSALPKIGDYNIYWVELTTEGIKVGINGSTNVDVSKTDAWGFAPADGLALDFLFAPAANQAAGWDSVLKSISDPKTDDNTPMMEIDWIRFYTNSTYSDAGVTYWSNAGVLFY